jgi:tetratricopeptide (TPR) repeat protein
MLIQLNDLDAVAATQLRLGNLTRVEAFTQLYRSNLTLTEAIDLVQKGKTGDRRIGVEQAEQFYQTAEEAIALYHQAVLNSTASSTSIQAQLNQLRLLLETERQDQAIALLPQVQHATSQLPLSSLAIDTRINLARSLINANSALSLSSPSIITQLLTTAIQNARELQDVRGESYALGYLGELYEQTGQLEPAQHITQNALALAQSNNAPEIAYHWQWQLGQLLKAQADAEGETSTAYH